MSKTENVLNALQNGVELTAKQIVNRYRFASTNSARKAISSIRDLGYDVVLTERMNSKGQVTRKYSMTA